MSLYTLPSRNQGIYIEDAAYGCGVPGGIFQYLAGGINDRAVTGTVVDMADVYDLNQDGEEPINEALVLAVAAAIGPTVLFFKKKAAGVVAKYLVDGAATYTGYTPNITIRGELDAAVTDTSEAQYLTEFLGNSGGQMFIASDPGGFGNNIEKIVGTKTKDTTTLTFESGDSSAYEVGRLVMLVYGNENDETRIAAGGMFTWGSGGTMSPYMQQHMHMVTAVGTGTITIFPGIGSDATLRTLFVATQPLTAAHKTTGWGFEDFKVTFADPPDHSNNFISFTTGARNWCYNLRFTNWHRESQNGSCILWFTQFQSEIRHCWFHALPDADSDGAIQVGGNTCCVEEDLVISGAFGMSIYDSGNCHSCFRGYNYSPFSVILNTHSVHPTLNLAEGNYSIAQGSDGYHGSSSNNNIFNCHYAFISLQRCKRQYEIINNVVEGMSLGNPNIGNGMACGFVGPTGLSTRAGTIDYIQNCEGVQIFDYEIQESDIFEGDFHSHWKVTAELVDRIDDKIAQFQVSHGLWRTGLVPSGGNAIIFGFVWGDLDPDFTLNLVGAGFYSAGGGVITDVTGDLVTVDFTTGTFYSDPANVLPAEGTMGMVGPGPAGWQERDFDTEATSTFEGNLVSGVMDNLPAGRTYPASFRYSGTPGWWNNKGFAGTFPPDMTLHDPTVIPAGYRYFQEQPPAIPVISPGCTMTGTPQQGQQLLGVAGTVTEGNPPPTRTWEWERDDVVIDGATSITYTNTSEDVGCYVGAVQVETNSEAPGGVRSRATPVLILPFAGDIFIPNKTANSSAVVDVWQLKEEGTGTISYRVYRHSGPWPANIPNQVGKSYVKSWGNASKPCYTYLNEGQDDSVFIAKSL